MKRINAHKKPKALAGIKKGSTEADIIAELFRAIDSAIRIERLYADQYLQRQDICDQFGINRHKLNDILAIHANGQSFPQYINSFRLAEALKMLREHPEMNVSAIAAAVGFTPANLREQFKQQYGVTPVAYRQEL